MTEARFCPFCGAQAVGVGQFCFKCGQPLAGAAPAPQAPSPGQLQGQAPQPQFAAPPPAYGAPLPPVYGGAPVPPQFSYSQAPLQPTPGAPTGSFAGVRPNGLIVAAGLLAVLGAIRLVQGFQNDDHVATFHLVSFVLAALGLAGAYALWVVDRRSWVLGLGIAALEMFWALSGVLVNEQMPVNVGALVGGGVAVYCLFMRDVRALFGIVDSGPTEGPFTSQINRRR